MDSRSAWTALEKELDRWHDEGRLATLWWRDDDAVSDTPALRRLLRLAGETPLALAVIPARTAAGLDRTLTATQAIVLQHGFAHENHAPPAEKKTELGAHRPLAVITDELATGLRMLRETFADRFRPVLVPPWNRIASVVTTALPELGFSALSTYRPRIGRTPFVEVNCHVDIVDWRCGRRFIGVAPALDGFRRHLGARRSGEADPAEPTGLLTHHLVMDEPGWDFVAMLLVRTRTHRAVRWIGLDQALTPA